MLSRIQLAAVLVLGMICSAQAAPQNVTTWRYDISRTGQNTSETTLTPENVNSTTFGKLFLRSRWLVYAQPLYLAGVSIPGLPTTYCSSPPSTTPFMRLTLT